MSQEKKLSAVALAVQSHGAAIVEVVGAQIVADDKWVKVARALFKDEVRIEHLTKPTEKVPNPHYDAGAYDAAREFVIAGINAKKKVETFTGMAGKWSFAEIIRTDAQWLRVNDAPDSFRAVRKAGLVKIDQLIGKIVSYIDREQNPDKVRGKKEKKDAGTAVAESPNLSTREGALLALDTIMAKRTLLGIPAGRPMTEFESGLTAALVVLRAAKPKA